MSQGYDQSSYTAWVGLCRFDYLPTEGLEGSSGDANAHLDQDQVFEAPVAVYTASAGDFDLVAGKKLQEQGYRFLSSSSPKPVLVWFTEKGQNKALGDLASQVRPHQPFAIGNMKAVAYKSQAGDIVEGEKPEEDPLVITEHPITPLPDQNPIWPPDKREWIDEELKNLLFGQELPPEHQHILKLDKTEAGHADKGGEASPPLIRTYFIVDAHLRRKFTGFFDLDMQFRKRPVGSPEIKGPNGNEGNIEYRSLFKGEAQEELKEVAPYLFDMTLPDGAYEDKGLVPDFHKDFFKSIWDPETLKRGEGKTHLDTGIFIRTTQDFDTVWRHFRKFTRIQDENGKWYYWRFWELRQRFGRKAVRVLITKADSAKNLIYREATRTEFEFLSEPFVEVLSSAPSMKNEVFYPEKFAVSKKALSTESILFWIKSALSISVDNRSEDLIRSILNDRNNTKKLSEFELAELEKLSAKAIISDPNRSSDVLSIATNEKSSHGEKVSMLSKEFPNAG